MKITNIAVVAGVVLFCSGVARAGSAFETERMGSGAAFSEQQVSGKLGASAEPVRIAGEYAPVETAKCNAEARDYNKLSVKAPPAPVSETAKDAKAEGKKGEITGGVAGGVVGGVVGLSMAAVLPLELAGVGAAVVVGGTVLGAVAVGAAVGYGVVHFAKKMAD